jgi:hypothetical protein
VLANACCCVHNKSFGVDENFTKQSYFEVYTLRRCEGVNQRVKNANNLFFMISDVDPFSAKPVLDFIITAYNDQAVIAILIY